MAPTVKKSGRLLIKLVSMARTGEAVACELLAYASCPLTQPFPQPPDPLLPSVVIVVMTVAGYFYVTEKNPRNTPWKLKLLKYDPVVKQKVLFEEQKLK